MRFVIDLDSLYLIESATDRRPVQSVSVKRGDDAPFEVVFVRSGTAQALAAETVLTFGCKAMDKYDADAVVLSDAFTLEGSDATSKYTGNPSFNTVPLNALFLIDGNPSNDVKYVDLMAEFTWGVGEGAPTSTKTFIFRVQNDVIRGTEGTPLELPTPEDWLEEQLLAAGLLPMVLDDVPLRQARQTITVVTNTSSSWSLICGDGSAGESSPSYANTTAGAAGRAALINADADFPFFAYNVANVIHLVAKPEYLGSAGNGISFSLSGSDLSAAGSSLAGGLLEAATHLGQIGQAVIGGNTYSFRVTGTGEDSNWEGATSGLEFNWTIGDWRMFRLSAPDNAWNRAPYLLNATYP